MSLLRDSFRQHLRVVLLDRDGVINRKAPEGSYVRTSAELELLPGAAAAIRVLNQRGILVIVVTNQRGIALGQMTERDLGAIHESLGDQLAQASAHLDAIYYCPHDYGQCNCRKPQTGMLEHAFQDFPVADLANTILIGDSAHDIEAGKAFGLTTVLLTGGKVEAAANSSRARSDLYAVSLWHAISDLLA